ncbi:MAG: hypothetical protein IM571_05685 [Chitinophagaceae bacterium]|nr:hypothetical protein [Chitinophagaceae bacterium]MCA6477428.1 hypothetical protein [Chitinophagaceae bacterium]MCA6489532.1 hypothetical protein [Chitinophagaceae bacterium]MCA6492544.1 hypothetical protein [Chitinophagaceae bacterium]MCA6512937.1 hypothetical protein [Chitinophagaceae bacterium]
MKLFRLLCLLLTIVCCISSCSILGKQKSGCPQGRNVGAERILQGDKKAMKIASKKSKLKI